jgi:hypothetical protein
MLGTVGKSPARRPRKSHAERSAAPRPYNPLAMAPVSVSAASVARAGMLAKRAFLSTSRFASEHGSLARRLRSTRALSSVLTGIAAPSSSGLKAI